MSSVAEVKGSIAAILERVGEVHESLAGVAETLTETVAALGETADGSEHEMMEASRQAFQNALDKITECQESVRLGAEQAETYSALI